MAKYLKSEKEKKQKELLSIQRQVNSLHRSIRTLPKVQLDKPRFMGYKRYFVLREDITRRNDAKELREILGAINRIVFSKTKDFTKYDYDDKKLHWNKQRVNTLAEKEFKLLNAHQKTFFAKVRHSDFRKKEVRHAFIYPYFFVFRIRQHYVTEVPMLDSEIESKLTELQNKINVNHLGPQICKAMSRSWGYRDSYYTPKRIKLAEILVEEDILSEIDIDVRDI